MKKEHSFWKVTVAGLAGAVIGYFSVLYAQKQANTVENQYFMQLDQLRHDTYFSDMERSAKIEILNSLKDAQHNGFQAIFEANIDRDITELDAAIKRIAQADSEADAAEAERLEDEKEAADAQARKEEAVRKNPIIRHDCAEMIEGRLVGVHCP